MASVLRFNITYLASQQGISCSLARLGRQHGHADTRLGWHSRSQVLHKQQHEPSAIQSHLHKSCCTVARFAALDSHLASLSRSIPLANQYY